MVSGVPRGFLAAVIASTVACAEQPAPAYTRISGPAPAVLERTTPTLVVFWATWCPPCREETGALRALARDPVGELALVTFGQDETDDVVRKFFGGDIPNELNYRRDASHAAAGAFGVDVLPAAFLVKNGRLVARFGGPRDWNSKEMRRLLRRLLTEEMDARTVPSPAAR